MERIVLEVDGALARAWRNSSPEIREMYGHKINDVLKELQSKETEFTEKELAIINRDAAGERYEWWNDEEMVAELDRRSAALESGEDKGFTLEESRAHLMALLKKNDR